MQVQLDNPGIPHDEAVKLAYLLNSYGITLQLKTLPEPAPLSSAEIHEMVTKLTESPIQAGYAQSPWSIKDLQCKLCGNIGHTEIVCSESPEFVSGP